MSGRKLGVGIVGVNAERSWAKDSHVPALRRVPELELRAVSTRSAASARAAASAFGVPYYFDSAQALAECPAVDIVVISVKVPHHLEVVQTALAARKHVLCEWPLGRNVKEAEFMAEIAAEAGVHNVIGLQARMSPAARRAAEIVRSGELGRPLTATIRSPTASYGPTFPSQYAWLMDPTNGADLLSVLGGHTLDLALSILGEFTEVAALNTIMFGDIKLVDPPGHVRRHSPDHVLIHARLANDCALAVEVTGNRPDRPEFELEVVGGKGRLKLTGAHPYGVQASRLELTCDVPFERPDRPIAESEPRPAINVAEVYQRMAHDILNDEHQSLDFDHSLRLTRLIRAVEEADKSGRRQKAGRWPVR